MQDTKVGKPAVKLTKSIVEKLPVPTSGQEIYRDSELKGFAVRITVGGTRTYVVEKRIGGKVRRVTLSRTNVLSAEEARKRAQQFLGKVAGGRNPITEAQTLKAQTITLREVLDDYLCARGDKLKPRTQDQYRDVVLAVARTARRLRSPTGETNASSTLRRTWFSAGIASCRRSTVRPGRTLQCAFCGCSLTTPRMARGSR
jgi:hypothetical protein